MRSSSLSTIVCLAVAVIASPTPLDLSSLEARDDWTSPVRRDVFRKRTPEPEPQPEADAWTPPVRRDVFLKRTPEPEPQPESVAWMSPARRDVFLKRTPQPETDVDKRAPFILTRNSIPSSDSIDITPSVNSANSRLPFFFKRDGKLQSRDIEALEARKAELEQREAEEFARLETEELSRREAEDLVLREVEELVRREAEKLEAREASALRKRAAFEDIEARELELESAKREYEEMFRREYEAEVSRDLESREPLSFTLPRNMVVSGRRLPFDLTVSLDARDFDDEVVQFAKREPQFNIASLISQLSGNSTAGAGGSTNSNSAASRLSALTNGRLGNNAGVSALTSALSRFGFNFRREEEPVDARDFDDAVAFLSKREPQFNIASLISQLSGNSTAAAGGSTNTNSAASRLSALTNGRLGNNARVSALTSALSRLGFNFRR